MSDVTNLLIAFSLSEDEEKIQQQLRQHVYNNITQFDAVSADSPTLPKGWYAGSKYLEAQLLIGAYNHLNLDELFVFMKNMTWECPEDVQLIVKEQWDSKFRLIDLFPEA
ncbi:hypothetical protein [Hymenobacter negativus]|uniref:Uncharacterized protein n=1 Tax=Hymenobacter negativus TaxID=2795026 RepID=A0ABS3Q9I3_9BACT|nr:hypothetical protein [Hymenobacter negativus]MBO2007909.1 hypothetical protein [Hymenobacter negativus]